MKIVSALATSCPGFELSRGVLLEYIQLLRKMCNTAATGTLALYSRNAKNEYWLGGLESRRCSWLYSLQAQSV
jgi:hypothetical protein